MITRKNGNSLWQVYFLFADPCVAVMPMEMTRPSSPKILSMLSCWCSCFISPNPLSFFVWGGWVEMHIFLSLQPTPIPTNVHVLSSVLFPSLLHPKVELRSCPHTQTLTLYSVKRSVFSWTLLGGWSRHNDRACEGRNGESKLVSDWELRTTYPTGFYP